MIAGGATGGVITTGAIGLAGAGGVTTRGGATLAGGAGAVTGGFATGGGGAGFAAGDAGLTGTGVGCGAAALCCLLMIAFSTSPGLEMWERSIFVFIPSGSARATRADFAAVGLSPVPRKWARTFSASCSSSELECVFFSVTPTSCKTSRIALLLTSSSLARSLIRILLIRLLFPPHCPAKSS